MVGVNSGALHDVADLIEYHQRLTLRYFAAFVRHEEGARFDTQGHINGARVPTAEQLLEGDVVDEHGVTWATTACIVGWTNAMAGHDDLEDWRNAADVLGLDDRQARSLFFAQTKSTLWRSGDAAWSGKDYREITAAHAVPTLRGIADGRIVGRGWAKRR